MPPVSVVEKNLLGNDILYSQLIEVLPVAIYTCNKDGYITSYNQAAAELWGRHPLTEEDRWCGSWKIFRPDGTPLAFDDCPMALTLKNGQPVTGEEIIIERPDGTRKNILPHPQPVFDTLGQLTGVTNMLVDITERKAAEAHQARLAAIVQDSEDAIISKTLEGIVTSWNPAAERLFGYTEQEMIGQPIIKLIPAHLKEEEPAILERLKRGEKVDHFETKRITKDRRLLDISLTISPLRNKQGTIIGVSKIARNITVQRVLSDALREGEERLRMASEYAQLGIWEFDPQSGSHIWSDQCRLIFGASVDQEITQEFVDRHILPDDKPHVDAILKNALDPHNDGSLKIVFRIRRANDGQLRWLQSEGRVTFTGGMPERMVGILLDITEEKQALQQTAESEERLRLAIQATQLGTWEYVPSTGSLTWSEECRKMFNVPGGMSVDYPFFQRHVYPEDLADVETAIANAMDPSGNGSYDIQYRIQRYDDNQVRWVSTHGKVYFNNGLPDRFIGTIVDITKEKAEEQELKNSVELFQTMADNVPAMIWMSGSDKFNDYFNKTWLSFRGKTIEEEGREGWVKGVHPEDIQKCTATYQKAVEARKGFYTEYRLLRHDNKYRWISDNCVPRYSSQGEFVGFISACIDIDDQKRFREKIQENELLLKTIANAAPVGLWMTDTNGMNTFVNETWIEWTGIPYQQQLGTGWLDRLLGEDKEQALAKFQEVLRRKEKYSTEFRIIRKDGEVRWCFTEGFPYYDINGVFAGYAGSVTDITDIKKMEERKDDFIKMASHELKTPITSIKGYVQLLLNIYDEFNEEKLQSSRQTVKTSLSTISKQVSKLTRLISELLDLSRIESGKLELYKTEFDPGTLVEEAVQDVRQTTTRHAIIIHNEFEGTIFADKDRIAQVLLNLLTNGVKYSPEADKVEVFVSANSQHVSVSVKDYGIGIDKKEHAKIFERFYRVKGKSEQTYPGFGIGLFIAYEIISRHEGKIVVDSEKGKGSVFTFTLPVLKR